MQEGLILWGYQMESDRMLAIIYVVALNLGIANPGGGGGALFLSEYLVSVIWKRSILYFEQMFFALYLTAVSFVAKDNLLEEMK